MRTQRPTRDDANEYYFTYIDKAPDGDIVEQLATQMVETRAMLDSLSEERAGYRYEPGKWSVKEVLGHVADAERVFAYRALAFSRGDAGPIPGMDQDEWSAGAGHDDLSFGEVMADLVAVRAGTVSLFRALTDEQWKLRGTASGFEFQAGAIAWIIAGHELHHRGVLVDRYRISG
jgi:uncharacterized damage-inducible protein DinB